uniref:Secreted protein n=1 Tax=Elaeophora elaphi TaxID=1147741 RepID=A0A0R3RMQ8_9BILA
MRDDHCNRRHLSMSRWIRIWLKISTVICSLDVAYTMLRPYTLRENTFGTFYELCSFLFHSSQHISIIDETKRPG